MWPLGYFLRAKLYFSKMKSVALYHSFSVQLKAHKLQLEKTQWQAIPELTNANGEECFYSCPAQAWSFATLLDVLYDIYQYNK